MNFDSYLFSLQKKEYVRGKRPEVSCILCAISENDERVESLKISETGLFVACINLYPYNNGHMMLFPKRHVLDIRGLTDEEDRELAMLNRKYLDILDVLYKPAGYNIGFNIGRVAGASIEHLHMHIIPRYPSELGMVDLIGGAKTLIETPLETLEKTSSLLPC